MQRRMTQTLPHPSTPYHHTIAPKLYIYIYIKYEKHGARLFTRELGPSWPSCSCVLMCLADCRPAFVQILSLLLRPSANDTVELAVLSQNAGTQLKSVEPFQLLSFAADASDARACYCTFQRFLAPSKNPLNFPSFALPVLQVHLCTFPWGNIHSPGSGSFLHIEHRHGNQATVRLEFHCLSLPFLHSCRPSSTRYCMKFPMLLIRALT